MTSVLILSWESGLMKNGKEQVKLTLFSLQARPSSQRISMLVSKTFLKTGEDQ
jgi:hypothetical protein